MAAGSTLNEAWWSVRRDAGAALMKGSLSSDGRGAIYCMAPFPPEERF